MFTVVLYRNSVTEEIRKIEDNDNIPDDVCGRHFHIKLSNILSEKELVDLAHTYHAVLKTMFVKDLWLPNTGLYFITAPTFYESTDESDTEDESAVSSPRIVQNSHIDRAMDEDYIHINFNETNDDTTTSEEGSDGDHSTRRISDSDVPTIRSPSPCIVENNPLNDALDENLVDFYVDLYGDRKRKCGYYSDDPNIEDDSDDDSDEDLNKRIVLCSDTEDVVIIGSEESDATDGDRWRRINGNSNTEYDSAVIAHFSQQSAEASDATDGDRWNRIIVISDTEDVAVVGTEESDATDGDRWKRIIFNSGSEYVPAVSANFLHESDENSDGSDATDGDRWRRIVVNCDDEDISSVTARFTFVSAEECDATDGDRWSRIICNSGSEYVPVVGANFPHETAEESDATDGDCWSRIIVNCQEVSEVESNDEDWVDLTMDSNEDSNNEPTEERDTSEGDRSTRMMCDAESEVDTDENIDSSDEEYTNGDSGTTIVCKCVTEKIPIVEPVFRRRLTKNRAYHVINDDSIELNIDFNNRKRKRGYYSDDTDIEEDSEDETETSEEETDISDEDDLEVAVLPLLTHIQDSFKTSIVHYFY